MARNPIGNLPMSEGFHHTNDIVLKNFTNNGLKKQQKTYATRELAGLVGFRLVETRFSRYYLAVGNNTDVHHEYAVILKDGVDEISADRTTW